MLAGHDFHTASDAADGAEPRSSDTELWWTGVLADAGYTVLSPDYRGPWPVAGESKHQERASRPEGCL